MTPPGVPPRADGSAPDPGDPVRRAARVPTRRERFRPLELLILAAVVAGFVGLIVLMSTRSGEIAVIFGGLSFIVSLMVFAGLALTGGPTGDERADLDEQDRGAHR